MSNYRLRAILNRQFVEYSQWIRSGTLNISLLNVLSGEPTESRL